MLQTLFMMTKIQQFTWANDRFKSVLKSCALRNPNKNYALGLKVPQNNGDLQSHSLFVWHTKGLTGLFKSQPNSTYRLYH